MLSVIKNEKGYITEIQHYFAGDYKTLDQLKFVVENNKPAYVIKTFTQLYLQREAYRPIQEAERRYAELLNQNKKTITIEEKINDETITQEIEVVNLTSIPKEAKELEEQYPHLKKFRENVLNNTEPEYEEPQVEVKPNDEVKEVLIQYCKLWAKRKICAFVLNKDEYQLTEEDYQRAIIKQMNYQADSQKLLLKLASGEKLSKKEKQELNTLLQAKERIDHYRQKSNEVEEKIKNATTVEELLSAIDELNE